MSLWGPKWLIAFDISEQKIILKFFLRKVFCTPSGHGHPRIRGMDVRTPMLAFPPGLPRDTRPENFLFGLFFVPEI